MPLVRCVSVRCVLQSRLVDNSEVFVVEASFKIPDGDTPGGTDVNAERCEYCVPAVALVESPSGGRPPMWGH
jgi:hypothetical protein